MKTKSEVNRKYNLSEKGRATQRKWRKDNEKSLKAKKVVYYIENKERIKKYRKDNAKRIAKRMKKWREDHKKEISRYNSNYVKTERGRQTTHLRDIKKRERRKGELGFHPISFPLIAPFDWHHVNKNDVVAISRDIHKAISHICGDGKLEGVVG